MNTQIPVAKTPAPVEAPLLAGIMRAEMLEGMQKLRASYAYLEQLRSEGTIPVTYGGKAAFEETASMLVEMSDKMELLAALAETYAGLSSSNQERVFLHTLLTGIIGASGGKYAARFVVREPQSEVAPVYGNKDWLRLLLSHLLRELDTSINPAERIVFTLRQMGNHMVLGSSTEALPPAARNRAKPAALPDDGLTATFCRRIAEQHGGALRLHYEEDGDEKLLSGITLSLPTSALGQPVTGRCSECPLIDQIECYANDLAVLMARCEQLERKPNA